MQPEWCRLGRDKTVGEEVWASPQPPRTLCLWRGGEVGSTGWGAGRRLQGQAQPWPTEEQHQSLPPRC